MAHALTMLRARARRARKEEDGSATIPFVIFFPFFILLVLSSLELGMMMIRHVMLERALDIAVRGLRLGIWTPPTHEELKRVICNQAGIIPDCMNALMVELRPVDKTTWAPLAGSATCVDRAATIQPVVSFDPGVGDSMMLIRACAKVDPLFPSSGAGWALPKDSTGAYSLISATAFVNEPTPGS